MDCRNFTLAARPHKTKSYATFSQQKVTRRSHNKKLLQNLNRQELLYSVALV